MQVSVLKPYSLGATSATFSLVSDSQKVSGYQIARHFEAILQRVANALHSVQTRKYLAEHHGFFPGACFETLRIVR